MNNILIACKSTVQEDNFQNKVSYFKNDNFELRFETILIFSKMYDLFGVHILSMFQSGTGFTNSNVGKSAGAWKPLQKASKSLVVLNKKEDSSCFTFLHLEAVKLCLIMMCSICFRLSTFIIWDLLEKTILKVGIAIENST